MGQSIVYCTYNDTGEGQKVSSYIYLPPEKQLWLSLMTEFFPDKLFYLFPGKITRLKVTTLSVKTK